MRKKAPVLAALAFLVLIAYVVVGTFRDPLLPAAPGPAPEPDGCRLEGQVLDAAGAPLPGVPVRARRVDAGAVFLADGRTDEAGRFSLRLFPPRGNWRVLALPPDRPEFGGPAVAATPGGRIEVVLAEPERPEAAPATEAPPNLCGEVTDRSGRSIAGAEVEALSSSDEVLARAATDEHGKFALRVETAPPLGIRLAPAGKVTKLASLPRRDLLLFVEHRPPVQGVMGVDVKTLEAIEDRDVTVTIYDSLGHEIESYRAPLSERPYRFDFIPYGAYDVRISAGDLGGAVQGFDFRPDNPNAVVPLGAAARLRGKLDRPAEVVLVSRSPTLVARSDWLRQTDGRTGWIRGVWASTWAGERRPTVDAFDFTGLPGGEYSLRFLGAGVETLEMPLALAAGEDRDLGLVRLAEARAGVTFRIRDREAGDTLEFRYAVTLYTGAGLSLRKEAPAGSPGEIRFERLPAGAWRYRVERHLTANHTRSVGNDPHLTLPPGEKRTVEVDATWRLE